MTENQEVREGENRAFQLGLLQGELGKECQCNLNNPTSREQTIWFAGWKIGQARFLDEQQTRNREVN